MRILLVDDDRALMETLEEALIEQRYAVDIALDGETARDFAALFSYDLIVLDMLLPDTEGIALCQQLRDQRISSPILMLTARDDHTDKIHALDAGADDYVTKPFDFDELCARIRALLRRNSDAATSTLHWGDLSVSTDSFEVSYGEHQIHTTPKEYALLELLLRHPKQVFSLDAIIENLWSFEDPPSEDAVRTHVKGLRQKLKAGGAPKDFVETVYGIGYRIKSLNANATSPQPAPAPQTHGPTKADVEVAVARAWNNHKGTMQERLSLLEAAATALKTGELSPELQYAGRSQAHKLAGSLGCFGFPDGSRLARELEHLLQIDAPLDPYHSSQFTSTVQQLRQRLTNGQNSIAPAVASEANDLSGSGQLPSNDFQLWVVGADESVGQSLSSEASAAGLCNVLVATLAEARDMLSSQFPEGIILWLEDSSFEAAIAFLEALPQGSAEGPDTIPVLAITDIQDFHRRLQIAQLGADRLLPTSVSPHHAIALLREIEQVNRAAFKVVIVDDDAQVLDLLKSLLEPWRLQVTTQDNPAQIESTLESVQPDMLVLDVEMPEANGLEICQVLRAEEKWRQLPILFLTVHEEADVQQQAFNVGADDFIHKSAIATDLPVRILNRLRR